VWQLWSVNCYIRVTLLYFIGIERDWLTFHVRRYVVTDCKSAQQCTTRGHLRTSHVCVRIIVHNCRRLHITAQNSSDTLLSSRQSS